MTKLEQHLIMTNVIDYHNKGFEGQGQRWLISEPDKDSSHAINVEKTFKAVAPRAYSERFTVNLYMIEQLSEKAIQGNFNGVNMSWSTNLCEGSALYPRLKKAIQDMLNHGIIVVTSIGNDGYGLVKSSNKIDPRMIVVGAVESDGDLTSYSSNDDSNVIDCCCPVGLDIYKSDTHGMYFGGTSEAAPFGCGMLACRNSYKPITDAQSFVASNCIDLEVLGYDTRTGYGLFSLTEVNEMEVRIKIDNTEEIIKHFTAYESRDTFKLDGVETDFLDSDGVSVKPYIDNSENKTYVPLRWVAETFGLNVDWDNLSKEIIIMGGEK